MHYLMTFCHTAAGMVRLYEANFCGCLSGRGPPRLSENHGPGHHAMNPDGADVFVEAILHLQLHHQQRCLAQMATQPANDEDFLNPHLVYRGAQLRQAVGERKAPGGVGQKPGE